MDNPWIIFVLGIGVAGAIAAWLMSRYRRGGEPDLGTVSTQWVAEQRLDGRDGQR